jgi:hypothetical protein
MTRPVFPGDELFDEEENAFRLGDGNYHRDVLAGRLDA